ncbi:MAG: HEAT repeat domain-containing protein [Planctomycetaceae bacterium]
MVAVATVSTLVGVVVLVVSEWQQIQIRYYIARFGKDRSYQSPHLYIDRSSLMLEAIGPAAIPYLASAYKCESRSDIRLSIILTLWGIGDLGASTTIIEALSDPDEDVREEAALIAGKLQICEARFDLRELANDNNERIRATAYYSLGEIGDEDDLLLLQQGMNDDDSRAAAEARKGYSRAKKRIVR